jgi:hypothetical protein
MTEMPIQTAEEARLHGLECRHAGVSQKTGLKEVRKGLEGDFARGFGPAYAQHVALARERGLEDALDGIEPARPGDDASEMERGYQQQRQAGFEEGCRILVNDGETALKRRIEAFRRQDPVAGTSETAGELAG